MSLNDDLKVEVSSIFQDVWKTRNGQRIPDTEDIKLGNDAVKLSGTILYADLSRSTDLVDDYNDFFAAEIYKTYLHTAAKIIKSEDGKITAYDGDRIMAVFLGKTKNTSAVRSSLKINYSVKKIINPRIKHYYPETEYKIKHTIGIDTSKLFIARTGIRGSNDLVWVGRAANYAAKMCNLSPLYPTWISSAVFNKLNSSVKKKLMWEKRFWKELPDINLYRSNWWCEL